LAQENVPGHAEKYDLRGMIKIPSAIKITPSCKQLSGSPGIIINNKGIIYAC